MMRALFRRRDHRHNAPAAAWPPVITTDRLVLRVAAPEDFDACARFYASDRSVAVGGPINRETAWRLLGTIIGHWALRGYGPFVILPKAPEAAIGLTGPWFPEGWPEPEISWMMWNPAHEGRGLMHEAASAARRFAYHTLGWRTAVSYIAPGNARSIALASRLGARPDPHARHHDGDPHIVYRHPAPEGCA
jgi:RimJ/RimL family protein N-acetyltransferase